MPKQLTEKIHKMEKLADSIYRMEIESEFISQSCVPGQFVNIKCSEGINALLRRPISICDVDRAKKLLTIVFQVKGIGTEYLSQKTAGMEVDLIAPLGKGFQLPDENQRIAVIGGGIGTFPLLNLLKESKCKLKDAYLGFRNKSLVVLKEEFENSCNQLSISTDDGSFGNHGLVVSPLIERLQKGEQYDLLFACGPMPMIKGVVDVANRFNIKCQISLEQRMGCGIGACLVCACKTKDGDNWDYSHVCKDGPVFWSDEVILEPV